MLTLVKRLRIEGRRRPPRDITADLGALGELRQHFKLRGFERLGLGDDAFTVLREWYCTTIFPVCDAGRYTLSSLAVSRAVPHGKFAMRAIPELAYVVVKFLSCAVFVAARFALYILRHFMRSRGASVKSL
jgi:hypothetical protein